jgi:hypothetical protein
MGAKVGSRQAPSVSTGQNQEFYRPESGGATRRPGFKPCSTAQFPWRQRLARDRGHGGGDLSSSIALSANSSHPSCLQRPKRGQIYCFPWNLKGQMTWLT